MLSERTLVGKNYGRYSLNIVDSRFRFQIYMSAYLSQLVDKIPLIGSDDSSNDYLRTIQGTTPKLKYITIFNPDYVTGKGELNEELIQQVFCFITDNLEGDILEANKPEQIRTIGLIQALDGLPHDFINKKKNNGANIIHISKSTIIVKRLEGNFTIACSISMPEDGIKHEAINQQMIQLINKSYVFFRFLNTSFGNLVENYNVSILKNLMSEHWTGFLNNYNSENFKFPPTVKWPNSLNYGGFLGFFDKFSDESKTLFKRSSFELNYNMKYEIDQILDPTQYAGHVGPKGFIISCFDKTVPKKYGMIHCKTLFDDGIQDNPILETSMIDLYNFLEYYDCHEKLNTKDLVKLSNDDLFSSPQVMKQNINIEITEEHEVEGTEHSFLRDSTNYAIDILNPINLTNNLVVLPINYTMNSMMNLRIHKDTSWLKLPSYLRFGANEEEPLDIINEEPLDDGSFLIGSVKNTSETSNGANIVERKLVYLKTKVQKGDKIVYEEIEYLLVVFGKNGLYMTLVFDSSASELDQLTFYETLKNEIIVPALDEITESISTNLEMSINSLPHSINGDAEAIENQIDSDFFFVIYDSQDNCVKSSLPFLPLPIDLDQVSQIDKSNLNIRSAMFYLHDQLLDLFFLQKTEFFGHNSIREYFHKFSTNKANDWMFYYLCYEEKYIIIMKNVNHNAKRKKKVISQSKTNHSILSENALKLDFVDNLGDDVRLWFENYIISGDT